MKKPILLITLFLLYSIAGIAKQHSTALSKFPQMTASYWQRDLYKLGTVSPPPNFCSKAITITCGQTLANETTVGAGNMLTTPDYGICLPRTPFLFDGPDKVYKITISTISKLQINMVNTTGGEDLDLFLFNDCSSLASCLASSTLSTQYPVEQISYDASPGTYYIVVDGYNSLQEGTFKLSVSCTPLNCNAPITLICGTPFSGTNSNGVANASIYKFSNFLTKANETGREKVHRFVLPATQYVLITLKNMTADLDMFLMRDDCNQDNLIACSYSPGDQAEVIYTQLPAGTYFLVVDGYDGAVSSYSLTLRAEKVCASASDLLDYFCQSSNIVKCGEYLASKRVSNNNRVTTKSYDCFGLTDGFSFEGYDETYRLTLTQTEEVEISLKINSDADLDLFLFSSCDTVPNRCITSSNNRNGLATGPIDEEIFVTLPAGEYYIVVDGDKEEQVGFDLAVNCGELNCGSAVDLTCGVPYTSNNNTGVANVAFYSEDKNNDGKKELVVIGQTLVFSGRERVHKFEITEFQEGDVSITLNGLSQNLDLILLDSCDKRTVIARSNQTGLKEEKIVMPLKAGSYYAVVDAPIASNVGNYTLTVDGFCNLIPYCNEAMEVECRPEPYEFDNGTAGVTNKLTAENYQSCIGGVDRYAAPDYVFKLDLQDYQPLKLRLEIQGAADLDLFLLDGCIAEGPPDTTIINCLASSTGVGTSVELIDLSLLPTGTYYIVVDGKTEQDLSAFSLVVDCNCTCVELPGTEPYGDIVLCENFQLYSPGGIDPQSDRWHPIGGSGQVTTQQGGSKYLMIQGAQGQGALLDFGNVGQGFSRRRLSWQMVVSPGKEASYFLYNLAVDDSTALPLAAEVDFLADGTGKLRLGNQIVTGEEATSFDYIPGDSLRIMHLYDQSKDLMELWINGNYLYSWSYSTNAGSNVNDFTGILFSGSANASYTIDDICLRINNKCQSNDAFVAGCVKNGIKYTNYFFAKCDLYSSEEVDICQSICDWGPVAISRGLEYERTLEQFDLAPSLLKSEPCVQEYFGRVPADPFYADIYVYQHDGTTDVLDFTLLEATPGTGLFAFLCEPSNDSLIIQTCLGYAPDGLTLNIPNPVAGEFYYIVVAGNNLGDPPPGIVANSREKSKNGDNEYTLTITPEGVCRPIADAAKFETCGGSFSGSLQNDGNEFDRVGEGPMAYASCYSGSRDYTGPDKEFRFTVERPSVVTFTLDAAEPMGMFLFGSDCGQSCIGYGENLLRGGKATFSDSLSEGIYYLIVDKAAGGGVGNFNLSIQCQVADNFESGLLGGDPVPADCPTEAGQLHTVNISKNAYNNFKPGDKVYFLFRNKEGGLEYRDDLSKIWSPNGLKFDIPADNKSDDINCSYNEGDDLLLVSSTYDGGRSQLRNFTLDFSQGGLTTATDKFKKGGRSSINKMVVVAKHLSILPNSNFLLAPDQTMASFSVVSNARWQLEILNAANVPWLNVNKTAGRTQERVGMQLQPNPDILPRKATIKVTTEDNSGNTIFELVTIEQQGRCLPPQAKLSITQSSLVICAGDSIRLKASGHVDLPWRYSWSTGATLVDSITLKPLSSSIVSVTVTHPQCDAADTVAIQINRQELPATPVSSGNISYCAGEEIPALTVNPVQGVLYDWYASANATQTLPGGLGTNGTFKPASPGTFYVQARTTNGGCQSLERSPLTVGQVAAPQYSFNRTTCSPDLKTYTAVFTLSNGVPVTNFGSPFQQGNIFTLAGIPADSTLRIQVNGTGCAQTPKYVIQSPGCACPVVQGAVSGGNASTCAGGAAPTLKVTVGNPMLTVDWYGTQAGGEPLVNGTGTLNFQPPKPGIYYAQTRDLVSDCRSQTRVAVEWKEEVAAVANAGADQLVCAGQVVQLAGNIGGSAKSGTWSASVPGGSFNPGPNAVNAAYTLPPTATSVVLKLQTDDPEGICPAVADELVIQVNQQPTVNAGVDQSICAGETVQLASTIGSVAQSAVWSASVQGGSFSPNESALNAVYTPPLGAQAITLTLATDDPAGPCPAAVDQVQVKVDSRASVQAGSDQIICQGDLVELVGNIGGAATKGTWTASVPGGVFSPGADNLLTTYAPPSGVAQVVLTLVTDDPAGACPAVTDMLAVVINPPAVVTAGADQVICSGQVVALSGTVSGAGNGAKWTSSSPGGVFTPNDNALDAAYSPPLGSGEIILTLTSNDPEGPCPTVMDTIKIISNTAPAVEAGSDQAVCEGAQIQLQGDIGGSAVNAVWSASTGGGTFTPGAADLVATYFPPAGVSEVVLILKTNDPEGPCTAIEDSIRITIHENPIATIDTIFEISCFEGSDGRIGLGIDGGDPPYSITWSNGSKLPVLPNLAQGTYKALVEDLNGCIDSVEATLQAPDPLEILNTIIVNISQVQDTGSIEIVIAGGRPPYRVRWLVDQILVSEEEKLVTPITGDYIVEIKDDSGCILIDTLEIKRVTSVEKFTFDKEVKIFPNPTDSRLFVQVLTDKPDEMVVDLLDVFARPVLSAKRTVLNKDLLSFDLSNQASGVYLVRVRQKNRVGIKKIIYQK